MIRDCLTSALLIALAACAKSPSAAAHQAEERAQIVSASGGSNQEQCAADRETERAWLDAMNHDKYAEAKKTADLHCRWAELERL